MKYNSMIEDKDIIFVTTSLYTKWLDYQQSIIKKLFPSSDVLVIDGRSSWPNSWFFWIKEVKKSNKKYYVHIDEDFFITSKEELLENNGIDIMGVPDGLHHFRGANPVAINTFLMIGKTNKLECDFDEIKFTYNRETGWKNNYNLYFKEEYKKDWIFNFESYGKSNFKFEQEPYYTFLWQMKENGYKFDYLYPHFDDRFKSTNPRILKESDDIGIHMWYTRQWNSEMDVWGMSNVKRYELVEKFILKK